MRRGWLPGRDPRAVRHPGAAGQLRTSGRRVVVVGGGIAGLAAAVGLAERGVDVELVEQEPQLGGRVRSWPVDHAGDSVTDPPAGDSVTDVPAGDSVTDSSAGDSVTDPLAGDSVTMSRGFHAFFRQYYNLRALLRRVDPLLQGLTAVADYPLISAAGQRDSFAAIPKTPPLNLAAFVAQSPSFTARDLTRVDVAAALELLDVEFPDTFSRHDGESAAQFLDRLRFPDAARHLALEVFARSFFARPEDFSAGELVAMFHTYFLGSAEGLLFDVPADDYDTVFWAPLGRYLCERGARIRTGTAVASVHATTDGVLVELDSGEMVSADAVVLATDLATTRRLVDAAPELGDTAWRQRVAATADAPPFAVWRGWFDRPVNADRPAFLGTSGYGPLDNVTVVERFEAGARTWADRHHGSVVELHAYALDPESVATEPGAQVVRDRLLYELHRIYPETARAGIVAQEWLLSRDCPLVGTGPWAARPDVVTPDPRIVLAGDGIRCDYPVALMERAATTGWLAANTLLSGWDTAGHDLWTVPMRGPLQPVGRFSRAALARRPARSAARRTVHPRSAPVGTIRTTVE